MLQNTEDTLTNSQISEFILDREYTNYFHLQQAISELVEADLISMDIRSNTSHRSESSLLPTTISPTREPTP